MGRSVDWSAHEFDGQRSLLDWVRRERDAARDAQYAWSLFLARRRITAEVIVLARQSDTASNVQARVYFIQEGTGGPIKIGTSTRVRQRLRELRVNAKDTLVLRAMTKGGRWVEALLHSLFSHARIRGEWFKPAPELLEYIEEVRVAEGTPETIAARELEELFEQRRKMRISA
jgi:hypothetical protein